MNFKFEFSTFSNYNDEFETILNPYTKMVPDFIFFRIHEFEGDEKWKILIMLRWRLGFSSFGRWKIKGDGERKGSTCCCYVSKKLKEQNIASLEKEMTCIFDFMTKKRIYFILVC